MVSKVESWLESTPALLLFESYEWSFSGGENNWKKLIPTRNRILKLGKFNEASKYGDVSIMKSHICILQEGKKNFLVSNKLGFEA
jgi:hypothetical protein